MESHGKKTLRSLTVLTLALAPACVPMTPPAQNSGAVQSHDGVALAITRQGCSQTTETEEPSWDLVEERLAVEVQNRSPEPITVHRDEFRLLLPDGSALKTVTWGAAEPISVASGQNHGFVLRFMVHSDFTCQSAMQLDVRGGVVLSQHAVALGAISFVPDRSL